MTIASTCTSAKNRLLESRGEPAGSALCLRPAERSWRCTSRSGQPFPGPSNRMAKDHPMRDVGWPSALPSVDRKSIVPIYQQIYEDLREAILAGKLPQSTRLPPERALASKLGVNRSTVVHAYRELVADGLIEQRVGSGSRVARHAPGPQPRGADVPWWITLPPWRVGSF